MGPISRNSSVTESQLFNFPGSRYADPVFSWFESIGITDIAFLNSSKLGDRYKNNIFVGDITKDNLYFFEVNENRTGLKFDDNSNEDSNSQQSSSSSSSGLSDKLADNKNEVAAVTLATGFRGIADIKTGPDGLLYILTFDEKSQVMVKERYTGFQLHRVNNSGGLNTDDIDYALTANGSNVSLYTILSGLYKPLYLVSFSFCAQLQFKFLALSICS